MISVAVHGVNDNASTSTHVGHDSHSNGFGDESNTRMGA